MQLTVKLKDKLGMETHAYNLTRKGDETEGPYVSVQHKILRDISWGVGGMDHEKPTVSDKELIDFCLISC